MAAPKDFSTAKSSSDSMGNVRAMAMLVGLSGCSALFTPNAKTEADGSVPRTDSALPDEDAQGPDQDVCIESMEDPFLPIPDGSSQGARSTAIVVDDRCDFKKMTVSVRIIHKCGSDVRIDLSGPGFIKERLRSESPEECANDVIASYVVELEETASGEGEWALTVADLEEPDTGWLELWKLQLDCL